MSNIGIKANESSLWKYVEELGCSIPKIVDTKEILMRMETYSPHLDLDDCLRITMTPEEYREYYGLHITEQETADDGSRILE